MDTVSFEIDVTLDEDQVVDGRRLAADFVGRAYRLLLPYVGGCPGCADQLFSKLANAVLDEIHQDDDGDRPSGLLIHLGLPEERAAAQRAHLDRERASTMAALENQGTCH